MSRSISASSSLRISGSRTDDRAAVMCSERRRSTVALNEVAEDPFAGVIDRGPNGESERGDDLLRGRGLLAGDWLYEERKRPLGVLVPVSAGLRVRWRASEAAFSKRLVVPSALVEPERAEQTIATLCWSRYSLQTEHEYT